MVFEHLERRRGDVERHKENKARLANAYGRYETTGQGTIEIEQRVEFGCTYVEEPFMAYGSYIDVDEWADLLDLPVKDTPPLPQVTGFVTAWDLDDRDNYVGAWVAVSVYFPLTDPAVPADAQPVIKHHFTFSAVALKDVPLDLRD